MANKKAGSRKGEASFRFSSRINFGTGMANCAWQKGRLRWLLSQGIEAAADATFQGDQGIAYRPEEASNMNKAAERAERCAAEIYLALTGREITQWREV